ncbi:MAG TPA: M56 family metallopeptidase [Bryobacteraceae bacterium]|nr:M56 family metallopeptidase [Bryobacteraceae bacterium]
MIAHLLEWSIRAALMAAGTAAVLRLLRIRSAAARHAAWTAVLVVMLLMPVWTAWGPKVALPILPEAGRDALGPILPDSEIPQFPRQPATSTIPVQRGDVSPRRPEPAPALPWDGIVWGCYFAGAAVMLARLIAGTARARALVRRAGIEEGIFTCPDCVSPMTAGWLRPVILLPPNWRSWPTAELDAVLIHEREHVRRRDPLIQWMALLDRAVFWFHPLAWWLERKLAELAEDACDAAVLRRGCDPRLYSEYLIDLARAVQRAGARLPACGTTIDGGGLDSRIRRILDGGPMQRLSRRHATAAVALCGVALASFAACNLEHAQKPAPGQLSMNEMAKRDAAKREKKTAEDQALLNEAHSMTPEAAAEKVKGLKANPQDERTYYELMRYYEFHSDLKGKNALILWYIEHQPGGKVPPWNINPRWDRAAYDQGKRLWIANTKRPGASAEIYERAAEFLQGTDNPLAEDILLAGQRLYPEDARWTMALGDHYAMALLGSAEPRTEYNVIRSFSVSEAEGSYARSVRAKLDHSTDSRLLAQTAQWLMARGRGRDAQVRTDTLALADSLASRAVALDPSSETADSIKFRVLQTKEMQRLMDLQKLPAGQQNHLGDADRLLLTQFEMDRAWSSAGRKRGGGDRNLLVGGPNLSLTAAKARELLKLAQRAPGAPHTGYAVFEGNIMLGKVALRQGHKREAARYLLAAADAPASEELRHGLMLMNLPRTLIDWGERDAVAEFLERIASKTLRAKEFHRWAVQIRKGENPDMRPILVGCGEEPC